VVAYGGWRLGDLVLVCTSELCVMKVSRCVAHGFKGSRAGFKFAGRLWWPSLAADRGSGASRGQAPVMRRAGSRWSGVVSRSGDHRSHSVPAGSARARCVRYAFGAGSLSAPDGTTVTWGRTDGTTRTGMTADPGWACTAFTCHQSGAVRASALAGGCSARSRRACSEEPRRRTGCQEVRS
jgi:hypothetical protein